MKNRLAYLAFVTVSFLLLAEISLRVLGWNSTYMERSGSWAGQVITPIAGSRPIGKFHIYNRHSSSLFSTGEFQYKYDINALGVRENKDTFLQSPDSTYRILTLGDSFTEGVGADYPYSWPRVLETSLNEAGFRTEVFNAGVSGSDIWYLYAHLKEELIDLKPDLIIVVLNGSDMSDFIIRGGMERFGKDGQVSFRKLPWWEPFYRISHLVRAIAHARGYNHLLVQEKAMDAYIASFKQEAQAVTDNFYQLATAHGYQVFFIAQPVPAQVQYGISEGVYGYRAISETAAYWNSKGFAYIDLWDGMNENIGKDVSFKYSWPIDQHFNADGYSIMGKLIADSLKQKPELLTRK